MGLRITENRSWRASVTKPMYLSLSGMTLSVFAGSVLPNNALSPGVFSPAVRGP